MLSRLIHTLRSQVAVPTRSSALSRPSRTSDFEAESLLALHQRLQIQMAQIRAWNPTEGHLRDLMTSGLDAEERIRTLHNIDENWLTYIDKLETESKFYVELWQQLPGLRLRRLEHFDWTLTEPLQGCFDLMVQRHLARAALHFSEARSAFQHGSADLAQFHDRKGVQYCDDAQALLRCYRHGDQQHKDAVVAAFEARRSAGGQEALRNLLHQSAWEPPSEPATQHATVAALGEPIHGRLHRLEAILHPSALQTANTGPLLALLQADDSAHPQFGLQAPRPASASLLDPDRHLQARLDLLMRERPAIAQSPSPTYRSLLDSLEAAVEEAQAAQQKYQEAQLALTSLEQCLSLHPQLAQGLRLWWKEAQLRLELAGKAGKAGLSTVKAQRAAQCYDLATMTRQKLEHIAKGLWPGAERQIRLGLQLMGDAKRREDPCERTFQARLLQRFWALHWKYLFASTSVQAERLLTQMASTLRDVQTADSDHQRRLAARESDRINRPAPEPSVAAPAPFQPAPGGNSAHGCGPAEARPAP